MSRESSAFADTETPFMNASPLPVKHSFSVLKLAPALKTARIVEFYQSPKDLKYYYVILVEPDTNIVQLSSSHVAPSSEPYRIHRRYNDFASLHKSLVKQIKSEFGSLRKAPFFYQLPSLPAHRMFMTKSIAGERVVELDHYVRMLFQLPEKVTKSLSVAEFFGQRQSDLNLMELNRNEPGQSPATLIKRSMSMKAPSVASGTASTDTAKWRTSTIKLPWQRRLKQLLKANAGNEAAETVVAEDSQVTLNGSLSGSAQSTSQPSSSASSSGDALDSNTNDQSLAESSGSEYIHQNLSILTSQSNLNDDDDRPLAEDASGPVAQKLLPFHLSQSSPRPPSALPPPPPRSSGINDSQTLPSEQSDVESIDSSHNRQPSTTKSAFSSVQARYMSSKPAAMSPLVKSTLHEDVSSASSSSASPSPASGTAHVFTAQAVPRERQTVRISSKSSLIENLEEMEKQLMDLTTAGASPVALGAPPTLAAIDANPTPDAPFSAQSPETSTDVQSTPRDALSSGDARSVSSAAISVTREKSIRTLMTATLKRLNSIKREESSDSPTDDVAATSSVPPTPLSGSITSSNMVSSPLALQGASPAPLGILAGARPIPLTEAMPPVLPKLGSSEEPHPVLSKSVVSIEEQSVLVPRSGFSVDQMVSVVSAHQESVLFSGLSTEEAASTGVRGLLSKAAEAPEASPTAPSLPLFSASASDMILRLQVTHLLTNSTIVLRVWCNPQKFAFDELCSKVSEKFSKVEGTERLQVVRFIALERATGTRPSASQAQPYQMPFHVHGSGAAGEFESCVSPQAHDSSMDRSPTEIHRRSREDEESFRRSLARTSYSSTAAPGSAAAMQDYAHSVGVRGFEQTSIVDQEDYAWWVAELLSNGVSSPGAASGMSGSFGKSVPQRHSALEEDSKSDQSPALPWERARAQLFVEFVGDPPIQASSLRPPSRAFSEIMPIAASHASPGASIPPVSESKSPSYIVVTSPNVLGNLVGVRPQPVQYFVPPSLSAPTPPQHPPPPLQQSLSPPQASYFMTPDGVVYAAAASTRAPEAFQKPLVQSSNPDSAASYW